MKGRYEIFDERERVALEFSAVLTGESNAVSQALFSRLETQFDQGEIVEIAAVAGLFNYFNKFNNALCVPPTR
jgi:alkylhydroperoxidase family enzyme